MSVDQVKTHHVIAVFPIKTILPAQISMLSVFHTYS